MVFDNFIFGHPWFLLLLLLLPLLAWRQHRQRDKALPMVRLSSLAFAAPQLSASPRRYLPVLRFSGLFLLILALARPQTVLNRDDSFSEGIDIMISMDISHSMLAKDFQPDRLEAAKKVALDFIDKRQYDRIGLVVFSGESFTQCPLTTDHKILKQLLSNLQCGMVENGTAIGMGLANAVRRLQQSTAKSKIIILLTDGVNNAGYTSPQQAMEAAKTLGIKVYTIGIGTVGRAPMPVDVNPAGGYIYAMTEVEIDEELLKLIASNTGGQYFRATNLEEFENIYNQIDQLEKTKIEKTAFRQYKEHYYYFVALALLLLLSEWLLGKTVFKTMVEG